MYQHVSNIHHPLFMLFFEIAEMRSYCKPVWRLIKECIDLLDGILRLFQQLFSYITGIKGYRSSINDSTRTCIYYIVRSSFNALDATKCFRTRTLQNIQSNLR